MSGRTARLIRKYWERDGKAEYRGDKRFYSALSVPEKQRERAWMVLADWNLTRASSTPILVSEV